MAKKKLTLEDMLVPKEEVPYEVPENWCWVRWEYILSDDKYSMKRGPFGSSLKKSFFVEKGENTYKVYEQKNAIYDDNTLGEYYINEEKYNELIAFKVEKDDLIISCSGTLGRISKISESFERGVINQALLKLTLNRNIITNDYFIHLFRSSEFQDQILNKSQGSAIVNMMSVKELKQLPIPLPPLDEQERIVNRIESLFDKVDNAANLVDEARDGFERRRAAILEKAFSGELTKKWREENGVRIDLQKYSILEDSIQCDIPKLWEIVTLDNIINKINYGYTESATVEKVGPKFLRITDIRDNGVDWNTVPYCRISEIEYEKYKLLKNDIVVARTGATTGKNYIIEDNVEAVFASYLIRFTLKDNIDSRYISYFMKSKFYWAQIMEERKGIAQPGVNAKKLSNIVIPLPFIDEQNEIVKILDKLLEKEREVVEISNIIDNIDNIKKSILAKAFRGELGTNDLNEKSSIELLKELIK